jgi:hypothetical protein
MTRCLVFNVTDRAETASYLCIAASGRCQRKS